MVLIRSKVPIDSDIKVSPYLAHSIKFSTSKNLMVNNTRQIGFFDSAAIVVETKLMDNSAKYMLEFDGKKFKLNEFITRFTELLMKDHRLDVRHLAGERTEEFRQNLIDIVKYLEHQEIEFLEKSDVLDIRDLQSRLAHATGVPDFNSDLFIQMKRAFFSVSEDPVDLSVDKAKLIEFLREFLGVHFEPEDVTNYMNGQESITYHEFAVWWADGPGKETTRDQVHLPSISGGEFLLFLYKTLGIVRVVDSLPVMLTPDDFVPDEYNNIRNSSIVPEIGWEFGPKLNIVL